MIAEFGTHFQHWSGSDNTVADCLSCGLALSVTLGLDYEVLSHEQHTCPDLVGSCSSSSLHLVEIVHSNGLPVLNYNVSLGHP